MQITSIHNPQLKKALKLIDRKGRSETGLFLIEGYRELTRAAQGSVQLQTLFVCEEFFLGSNEGALIEKMRAKGAHILSCTTTLFRKLSYRDRPDGLIGVALQMDRQLSQLSLPKAPLLIIAEAIEKPGNLGTIIRSADAAGADGVIVCDRCTDIYNPNVVRASVGTLFTIPVIEVTGASLFEWLKAQQISIVAATPSATLSFTQAPLNGRIAIAVGTEQLGLSALWMQNADIQVRIPMHGVCDSLNVATATTLLLYEAVRQRCV